VDDILSVLVTYIFIFLALLSASLFLFILARRLVVQRREALFQVRYLRVEQDVLQAVSSGDIAQAVQTALAHRARPDVLTQVLVNFTEMISGRGREILKTIFDHALKRRFLKDLRSRLVARRLRATRLIGLFAASAERALLVDLLRDKPIVRLAAANALARVPDKESLALVFEAFEKDSGPDIHAYTNIIFGAGERIEPLVRDSLSKVQSAEKLSLLLELVGAIPLRSLSSVLPGYARHPEKEVRIKVAKALASLRSPDSYGTLLELAADKEWEVQAQALRGLGKLKDPAALEVLSKGLFSPAWHVRWNAREGLLDLGPEGVRRLEEVAGQTADRFAADMASMALESLRDTQVN
jgi:hypothetical protein